MESSSPSLFGPARDVPEPFASGSWALTEAGALRRGPQVVGLDIPQPCHGRSSNTATQKLSQNNSVSHLKVRNGLDPRVVGNHCMEASGALFPFRSNFLVDGEQRRSCNIQVNAFFGRF